MDVAFVEFYFKTASKSSVENYSPLFHFIKIPLSRLDLLNCVILFTSQFVYIISLMLLCSSSSSSSFPSSSSSSFSFFFLFACEYLYMICIHILFHKFRSDFVSSFFHSEIACIFSKFLIEKIQYSIFVSEAYKRQSVSFRIIYCHSELWKPIIISSVFVCVWVCVMCIYAVFLSHNLLRYRLVRLYGACVRSCVVLYAYQILIFVCIINFLDTLVVLF